LNFCHRDIKPENILLKLGLTKNKNFLTNSLDCDILDFREISWNKEKVASLELKISDFGVTKQLGSKLAGTRTGTLLYMAPEVLSEIGYDFKV
jgi:serine/threonine protein kinase